MDKFRAIVERFIRLIFRPLVSILLRLNISPNILSVAGFLIVLISVVVFVSGSLLVAGIIFLLGSLLDVLDGELARRADRVTPFGSVLDSLLDRLSEGVVLVAFAWYFADRGEITGVVITMLGMLGAITTSYVRARAEAIGVTCSTGWFTRPERVLVIAIGMIFGQMFLSVLILFLLSTLSVIHRVIYVRNVLAEVD